MIGGVGGTLAMSACVEAEGRFYIGDEASVSAANGATSCGTGHCGAQTVYKDRGDQQLCYFVTSGLIVRQTTDTNHVETNRILIHEVDVEVFGPGGAQVDSFSRAATGEINPATTDNVVALTTVRLESTANLPAGSQATLGIVIKGRTTGGDDIQTPEFFAPVYVENVPPVNPMATAATGDHC